MNILNKLKSGLIPKSMARPARWGAAAVFTICHIVSIALALNLLPMDTIWWLVPLLIVFPGIVSMTLLPGGWKRWYRWVALLGLVMMVLESPTSNPFLVILVGETWMLHRAWVTERTVPVRDLFRRGQPSKPVPAPGRSAKKSRRPKPA